MLNMPTTTPIQYTPIAAQQPVLKVLGLGGGGCNAVNRMIELGINGVQFIAANTDHQALQTCLAPVKIQLGPKVTRGLGAGGKPEVGKAAAEESQREIAAALAGADMVFLAAGMGGGTGTGSIPVAAKIARALKAVTIAVVTTPFSFEMGRRQHNANEGLTCLRPHTDTLISIPNDRLLYVAPRDLPMEVAFRLADDVLRQGVQGITELITEPGMINVDFAHIHHLMKLGGGALMSIGQGHGVDKALRAVEQALNHPLLETASLENAAGILANFSAGNDLSLFEIEAALNYLQERTGGQAEIVMGVTNDCNLRDRVEVFLVITGLGAPTLEEALANVKTSPRIIEASPEPQEELPPSPSPEATPIRPPIQQSIPPSSSQNLDIPAFLRKNRI
jgi:cell division protein FtsZ